MKSRKFLTMFTAVIVAALSGPAWAVPYDCDDATTTFTGPQYGAWQYADFWSDGVPDASDIACVPSDKEAEINVGVCDGGTNDGIACNTDGICEGGGTCDLSADDDVVAQAIVVDGILHLVNLATLTISDDSDVDGVFEMYNAATLLIGASLTITGNGGQMGMIQSACGWGDPRIESVSAGGYTLTLDSTTATYSDLTLMGRMYIDVKVVNQARVLANYHENLPLDFPVTLAKDDNTGPGEWMVESSVGVADCRMIFDGSVTGAGTFTVGTESYMDFNDASTSLTGDFDVDGYLRIYQNVTTSGDMDLTGQIDVAANKIASFSW